MADCLPKATKAEHNLNTSAHITSRTLALLLLLPWETLRFSVSFCFQVRSPYGTDRQTKETNMPGSYCSLLKCTSACTKDYKAIYQSDIPTIHVTF